jgi:hypothetical protein
MAVLTCLPFAAQVGSIMINLGTVGGTCSHMINAALQPLRAPDDTKGPYCSHKQSHCTYAPHGALADSGVCHAAAEYYEDGAQQTGCNTLQHVTPKTCHIVRPRHL